MNPFSFVPWIAFKANLCIVLRDSTVNSTASPVTRFHGNNPVTRDPETLLFNWFCFDTNTFGEFDVNRASSNNFAKLEARSEKLANVMLLRRSDTLLIKQFSTIKDENLTYFGAT